MQRFCSYSFVKWKWRTSGNFLANEQVNVDMLFPSKTLQEIKLLLKEAAEICPQQVQNLAMKLLNFSKIYIFRNQFKSS